MIAIELNGAPHAIDAGRNIGDLIDELELSGQALAVAVNREVVPRHLWPQRVVQQHDRVDIVRAIGGG
ncbi:MAG: sulfur carrier protein ThiS [Burkholderiales bacterium]